MKFPELEEPCCTKLDSRKRMRSTRSRKIGGWHLTARACGACEFLVPALAKRTNAFIDGFAKMLRDDNHYAATLFIRPTLEHVLIAIASDEYEGGHHEFAQRFMSGSTLVRGRIVR